MKVTSYFATPALFVDKVSRMKNWVYNVTEVFIQFCTERVWSYLEQDRGLFMQCWKEAVKTLAI